MTEQERTPRRRRSLTSEDLEQIREIFAAHRPCVPECRFPEMSEEDMVKVKEFVKITDKIKISILDKLVWIAIISIGILIGLWPKLKAMIEKTGQ